MNQDLAEQIQGGEEDSEKDIDASKSDHQKQEDEKESKEAYPS